MNFKNVIGSQHSQLDGFSRSICALGIAHIIGGKHLIDGWQASDIICGIEIVAFGTVVDAIFVGVFAAILGAPVVIIRVNFFTQVIFVGVG